MEKEYPRGELLSAGNHGSGSGTTIFYKVEVRTSYHSPLVIGNFVIGNFVIDHVWRELRIGEARSWWGNTVVPVPSYDTDALRYGLVPLSVAEAHRWAFISHINAIRLAGSLCIETRLVEVEFSYSYSTRELGVTPPSPAYRRARATFSPRFDEEEKEAPDATL